MGESAACAGGFQAVGSSVRQQQKSREQSYGSVLLLSLRPHLRLYICLIKRKQEVKIKMLHSSNYRFDRGQNQPVKHKDWGTESNCQRRQSSQLSGFGKYERVHRFLTSGFI